MFTLGAISDFNKSIKVCLHMVLEVLLTPKHLRTFFGPFLKFGQAIVDACNLCPKNLKFLVNMWFSTSFKMH
jgi:hypothetical protein